MSMTDQLKSPFDPKVIHWRVGATNKRKSPTGKATKGIALAYIDSRDVMKRLDEVCGDNWQCRYPFDGCCEIGIKINDEWIWRSNGAGETDVEGEKGKFSDAFKRAAVLWGVGRYLYYLKNNWVDLDTYGKFTPPNLPGWALPKTIGIVSGGEVDMDKVSKSIGFIRETIDADIEEEERTLKLVELNKLMTNDERIKVAEGLGDKAHGTNKMYRSIFKAYITGVN